MTALILDWPAAAAAGASQAGGKGAQLGRMAKLGLPVPPGFVISAAAAQGRQAGDPLDPGLADRLASALQHYGWEHTPLAVRSSATAEDSAGASFAGIHDSVLNVIGLPALCDAVRTVWDSLHSEHARAYRQRMQLDDGAVQMAVVVMPLLDARAAGIVFTADPVTGRADQIVIHANWGLGESLVAGQAEGDEYRLQYDFRAHTAQPMARRIGRKTQQTARAADGGTQLLPTPAADARRAVLTAVQASELALCAAMAAQALDYADPAYDIEWVWDGTRFWLVQARPITARPDYTYEALRTQPVWWTRGNTVEVLPDPLAPIEWSNARAMVNGMLTSGYTLAGYAPLPGADRASLHYGRIYLQASMLQWEAWDALGMPPEPINRMIGGTQGCIAVPPAGLRRRLANLRRMLRYIGRALGLRKRAASALRDVRHRAAAARSEAMAPDLAGLLAQLCAVREPDRQLDMLYFLQGSAGGSLITLVQLIDRHLPGEGFALAAALLAGGAPSVTAQQGYDLMELAAIASDDVQAMHWLRDPQRVSTRWERELHVDSPFRIAFKGFLQEYGHRAIRESYVRSPRWREDPEYLLNTVLHLQGSDPAALRRRQQQSSAAAWIKVRDALPVWARGYARMLAKNATQELNHREAARSAFVSQLEVMRRVLLALGQRMRAEGVLAHADDVFFLTMPEVDAAALGELAPVHAQARAEERRALVEQWSREREPEVIVSGAALNAAEAGSRADGVSSAGRPAARRSADDAARSWTGTAIGAGRVEGRCWVARTPGEGFGMEQGDILVVPATDPAWTPLFLKAGALVMETGGYLSHGAIVAREFGIPAVINVQGILDQVASGDRIVVDGHQGTVSLLRAELVERAANSR